MFTGFLGGGEYDLDGLELTTSKLMGSSKGCAHTRSNSGLLHYGIGKEFNFVFENRVYGHKGSAALTT
jgi:hypothetical protein